MKKLSLILALFVVASCAPVKRVVVVSTNDIHSSIGNFPRLATLVDSLRAHERHVLLVDAGDRWTGNPFVDKAPKPLSPIIELANELDYDVATLGNHEFDWGQPTLRQRLDEARFTTILANISSEGSELGPLAPYKVIKIGGVKFAFLGLTGNFIPQRRPEGKAEHFIGLTYPDVYETAAKYAWLTDESDVFVGLTHIGHTEDLELARRVPELDLIIGGHSHTLVEHAPTVGQTLVTQTGGRLEYAGVTTITKKHRTVRIDNRLVRLDTIPASPKYAGIVAKINDNPAMKVVVGRAAGPFNGTGVENLVTDAIRDAMNLDAALYHAGGIRVDTLAGEITVADMYSIEPFLSEVYTLEMTAEQIKDLLMKNFNSGRGARVDILPGGMHITFITDNSRTKATDVVLEGLPQKAVYSVAVPDYLYKNYPFDYSQPVVKTGIMVTDLMRTHIERQTTVEPENRPRVVVR